MTPRPSLPCCCLFALSDWEVGGAQYTKPAQEDEGEAQTSKGGGQVTASLSADAYHDTTEVHGLKVCEWLFVQRVT